jgi:hypothetical protein
VSTGESIKKRRHIYPMENYLSIKGNEIMSFSAKWIELEIIALSKIRQNFMRMKNITCSLAHVESRP